MKQFAFSLQSLYDIKKTVEFQQKIQMKTIEAKLAKLEEELREIWANIENTKHMYTEDIQSGVQANKLVQYSRYFDLLNVSLTMQQERIATTEKEKQKCLEAQVETRKEIKSLEKLYEIELEAYNTLLKQEQDKAIGDIVSYKVATT